MMDLRKYARRKPCMVRIPHYCNGDPETTVLAHIRMAGITGVGLKAPDLLGAWACSSCHDVLDGRVKHYIGQNDLRLWHLEAVARTIAALVRDGVIK